MKDPKVVAIVQARMGSSRLPGKVLMLIAGKPMLWHVINRTRQAKLIDQTVIATSIKKNDDKIAEFGKKNNIGVFRGPEKDVLDRYLKCAEKYKADVIVRITADCPLIDPKIIDEAIVLFKKGGFDLAGVATGVGVSKQKVNKFPDGLDCSVLSLKSLKKAALKTQNKDNREHVTLYISKNPSQFKLGTLKSSRDYSHIRLTVDYREDLTLVRKIYDALYKKNKNFGLFDIISLIKRRPQLLKINQKYIGREGYENLWQGKN